LILGGGSLCEAEEFALTHDCGFAHVETYSFQARGFYESMNTGFLQSWRTIHFVTNASDGHLKRLLLEAAGAGTACLAVC
jgi:hypothetical protein